MTYQGRALYNLLQMNLKQNPAMEAELWQVERYRDFSIEALFERLAALDIHLDQNNFLLYVDECDSPEDLADCLYLEEDYERHEQVYLCVFEIWRRLAPHKQSLSLFVDEFDHLIELYEEGNMEIEEELQDALRSFQSILDDNVDEGGEAKEGYHFFSAFSCHDLEIFVYEYISHQIDAENDLYASELFEGFYPYIDNKRWFDLLKVRLVTATDLQEGMVMIERLLASLKEEPELYLLFEVLHYLMHVEDSVHFYSAYHQVLEEIKTYEDLKELLSLTVEYFNALEKEEEEKLVSELLEETKGKDLQQEIEGSVSYLPILKQLIILSPEEDQILNNPPL